MAADDEHAHMKYTVNQIGCVTFYVVSSPSLIGRGNGVITLFFYFFHIRTSGSSVPVSTLPSPSTGFNLVTSFLGTRLVEFHWSVWFFRYQTDGTPTMCLIFQVPDQYNSIEISKRSASLHFEYELGWTAFFAFGTP